MALFTYADWTFELDVAADGNPVLKTNADAISQSIKTILSTLPGERVMYPDFGSQLPLMVFDACDEITANNMQAEIQTALETWENRIQLNYVQCVADPDNNQFVVNIAYSVIALGQNIVFSGVIDSHAG